MQITVSRGKAHVFKLLVFSANTPTPKDIQFTIKQTKAT